MGVNTPQKRAKLIKTLTLSFTIDKFGGVALNA